MTQILNENHHSGSLLSSIAVQLRRRSCILHQLEVSITQAVTLNDHSIIHSSQDIRFRGQSSKCNNEAQPVRLYERADSKKWIYCDCRVRNDGLLSYSSTWSSTWSIGWSLGSTILISVSLLVSSELVPELIFICGASWRGLNSLDYARCLLFCFLPCSWSLNTSLDAHPSQPLWLCSIASESAFAKDELLHCHTAARGKDGDISTVRSYLTALKHVSRFRTLHRRWYN